MIVSTTFVLAVAVYTAAAAVVDLRQHRIPNYLTVPAAVLGIAYHALWPTGWGLPASLGGFALGFVLLLLPWLLGGSGMGDVKLLAALGAWLGPGLMLGAFALAIFLAAVGAIAVLATAAATDGVSRARRQYIGTGNQASQESSGLRKRRVLPFAVPVALSAWGVLAWLVVRSGA